MNPPTRTLEALEAAVKLSPVISRLVISSPGGFIGGLPAHLNIDPIAEANTATSHKRRKFIAIALWLVRLSINSHIRAVTISIDRRWT